MTRIDPDDVETMNSMGLSDNRIAEKLGASQRGVTYVRHKLGLKANYPNYSGDNVDPKKAYKYTKAKQREYQQRPDVRAKKREYQQRPDVRAKQREYQQRPDVRAKKREYQRERREEAFYKVRGWGKPIKSKEVAA